MSVYLHISLYHHENCVFNQNLSLFCICLWSTSSWITFYYMQNKANHSFGNLRVFLPFHISIKWAVRKKREILKSVVFLCFFFISSTIVFWSVEMNGNMIFEWNFQIVHLDWEESLWSLNYTIMCNVMPRAILWNGHLLCINKF